MNDMNTRMRPTRLPRLRRARLTNARVYQRLRTAHLERSHRHTPASIVYVERSYDFDPGAAAGLDLIQAGTLGAPLVVLLSRLETLEVNEPLVRQRLLRTLLVIMASRLSQRLRRRSVRVVSHAIENRDPFAAGPAHSTRRSWLRYRVDWWLSRQVASRIDRMTFGTEGSQRLYLQKLGDELRGTTTNLILELAAPCTCPAAPELEGSICFLGAFDDRKGVRQLLEAWPLVHDLEPTSSLLLMGKGPLAEEVVSSTASDPAVEVLLDPPRDVIHARLRRARVLVLLSQPRARWQEQVGLPIVEGLAHGCTIVTTDQTGLAPWLENHGHVVTRPDASVTELARAIVRAARSTRTDAEVLADLPEVDGRTAADDWLFANKD